MDEANISNIDLPILLAIVFVLLSILSFYARIFVRSIHPIVHTAIFCLCIAGLIFCLIDIGFIEVKHQNANLGLFIPVSLILGIVCFAILIKSGVYKELGTTKKEKEELTPIIHAHPFTNLDNTLQYLKDYKVTIRRKQLDLANVLRQLKQQLALGATYGEITSAIGNIVPIAPYTKGYIDPTTHNPCPFCGTISERVGASGSHKFTCPEHGIFDNYQIANEIADTAKSILADLSLQQIITPIRRPKYDNMGSRLEVECYIFTEEGKRLIQMIEADTQADQEKQYDVNDSGIPSASGFLLPMLKVASDSKLQGAMVHKKELQVLRDSLSDARTSAEELVKLKGMFTDLLFDEPNGIALQVIPRAKNDYKMAITELSNENLRNKDKYNGKISDLLSRLTRGQSLLDRCSNVRGYNRFKAELNENSVSIVADIHDIMANWEQLGFYIQD